MAERYIERKRGILPVSYRVGKPSTRNGPPEMDANSIVVKLETKIELQSNAIQRLKADLQTNDVIIVIDDDEDEDVAMLVD